MRVLIFIAMLLISFDSAAQNLPAEVKRDSYRIGEIKISLLSPEIFNQEYGSTWVLMQGQELPKGSDFEKVTGMSKVPDARGKFLRMINNGASGGTYDETNRSLGSYQEDQVGPHVHEGVVRVEGRTPHGHSKRSDIAIVGSEKTSESNKAYETRPKNIGVNYFIKVSYCSPDEKNCL